GVAAAARPVIAAGPEPPDASLLHHLPRVLDVLLLEQIGIEPEIAGRLGPLRFGLLLLVRLLLVLGLPLGEILLQPLPLGLLFLLQLLLGDRDPPELLLGGPRLVEELRAVDRDPPAVVGIFGRLGRDLERQAVPLDLPRLEVERTQRGGVLGSEERD